MQIKYGFQKEWLHFSRTFRFGGIIIAIFSVALATPLLYKFMIALLEWTEGQFSAMTAGDVFTQEDIDSLTGMGAMGELFNDASIVYSIALADLTATALLIIMLVLMSPCGGEQKKRATIIPSCSGLEFKDYLLPKFVLYPSVIFVTTLLAGIVTGVLCDAMFTEGHIGVPSILLNSFICAVYEAFILCIYMCLGLCMSRPGIATIIIYFGQNLVNIILMNLGLTRFHPFTLYNLISSATIKEGNDISAETASIIVAVVLAVVIAVLMYFITLAVLGAKKINNQEDRPEF